MIYKSKVFYDWSMETGSASPEATEVAKNWENKEMLDELKQYVLDNKKVEGDTKMLVQDSVLNEDQNDFDMEKIKNFLSRNWDRESKATIVARQILLKKNNLYTDWKVDGIKGPLTNKAIAEFKKNNWLSDSDDLKAFSDKLVWSTSVDYLWKSADERLRWIEQKYEGLDSQLDFTKTNYFKEWFVGTDGSFSYAGENYKKVEDWDASYEGLWYHIWTQKVWDKEYKYVQAWVYKNGKLDGTWVQIYDDWEKHVVDFKDWTKSWYARKVYSDKDASWWKEYTWQISNDMNNGRWKLIFKDGSVYEWEFKDNKIEGKWKLTTANWEVKEWNFVDWKIQDWYQSNVQSETVTDDNWSAIYTEKTPDGKLLYEWIRHTDWKIDANWLESHKASLADENNYKSVLWWKTYKSDGSYEKITLGWDKRYSFETEMDCNWKWVPVIIEKMDKSWKWEMIVKSWGNELKIEVDNWNYKFVTPDPEWGWRFVLWWETWLSFGSFEDVVCAADMINFAVHGVDKRIATHPDETFDNFQKDGSWIDLDMHGNGYDIQWIRSNAENYFGGAKINDIAWWMTKYYRSRKKWSI